MLKQLTDRPTARGVSKWLTTLGLAATLPVMAATSAASAPAGADGPKERPPKPAATAKANNSVQGKILKSARQELGTTESGDNCQKYSDQCVSWCALFAMSTWEAAGVPVDNEDYAFTGNVYTTGQQHGKAYDSENLKEAKPGDVLLFGTSPSSASTSKHIGVVEKVNGDTVTTIEGNTGDDPDRVMRKEHQLSPDTFYGGVHPL